jgi:hypothetical protein
MAISMSKGSDDNRWWDIISVGCPHDLDYDDWGETLLAVLMKLPPDDILAFDVWFQTRTNAPYREDLWRAASLINGWVSDEGFHYFRSWLVGMGKKVYEAASRDPDSLVEVIERNNNYGWEPGSVAAVAWTEITGRSSDEFYAIRETMRGEVKLELGQAGWENTPEELQRRFPQLWVKAGNGADDDS